MQTSLETELFSFARSFILSKRYSVGGQTVVQKKPKDVVAVMSRGLKPYLRADAIRMSMWMESTCAATGAESLKM